MPRGGKRPNAGRKLGTGLYGCPTVAIRVPVHHVERVLEMVECWLLEEQMKKENKK